MDVKWYFSVIFLEVFHLFHYFTKNLRSILWRIAILDKANEDIKREKKKAINDAKDEISGLAMAIAGKVVERELNTADQEKLIDRFIDELGDQV